jgi:putative Mg2+ transporter-C (MgtC) family protein
MLQLEKELELICFILPKIIVATICVIIVGWERERKNKVAGLRTIVLICVGSTIFTSAAMLLSKNYNDSDPGRIISTILTSRFHLGSAD